MEGRDGGKGGREGVREGVLDIMHGRSGMTIDPRIPYNAGTEHVGFSRTRQTLLAPSAKRHVRRSASRMKDELRSNQEPLARRIFLHMDDSVNDFTSFPVRGEASIAKRYEVCCPGPNPSGHDQIS